MYEWTMLNKMTRSKHHPPIPFPLSRSLSLSTFLLHQLSLFSAAKATPTHSTHPVVHQPHLSLHLFPPSLILYFLALTLLKVQFLTIGDSTTDRLVRQGHDSSYSAATASSSAKSWGKRLHGTTCHKGNSHCHQTTPPSYQNLLSLGKDLARGRHNSRNVLKQS